MTGRVNILHISDFHFLGDEGGIFTSSRLDASISALVNVIGPSSNTRVLVATGDFICAVSDASKCKTAWARAKELLQRLSKQLEVPCQNIVLCPGNHDVLRSELFSTDGSVGGDGLAEYHSLARDVARPVETRISEFAVGLQLDVGGADKVQGLSLNMMYGSRQILVKWGNGSEDSKTYVVPGVISEEECRDFQKAISQFWQEGLLIVACHYPITNFDWSQAFEEAARHASKTSLWALNHVASGWGNILRVLENMCDGNKRKLLLLHGDTHRQLPVRRVASSIFASTSGRLDDPKHETHVPRHCRLYRVDLRDFERSRYDDVVYSVDMHKPDPSTVGGTWVLSSQEFPTVRESASWAHALTCAGENILDGVRECSAELDADSHVLAGDVGAEIRDRIRKWNLFELRRVSTQDVVRDANTIERMGHIRLGPILNDPEFFSEILQAFATWINQKLTVLAREDKPLIVGIDAWGAAMGASLGMRLNARSVGLTIRGIDQEERGRIIDSRPVKERIQEFKTFVLVTDVVVSGRTLKEVTSLIERVVGGACEIIAVCVIAARTPGLFVNVGLGFPLGAVVTDIEIPVVPAAWFPDVSVLPAESFGFGPARGR